MKIMKNFINLIVTFLFISNINAQTIITGQAINDSNQEPLSDINIIVVNENLGSATDDNGFFQLKLPAEISSFTLEASAVGFSSISKDLESEKVKNIVIFKLVPKIIELDPILIGAIKEVFEPIKDPSEIFVLFFFTPSKLQVIVPAPILTIWPILASPI